MKRYTDKEGRKERTKTITGHGTEMRTGMERVTRIGVGVGTGAGTGTGTGAGTTLKRGKEGERVRESATSLNKKSRRLSAVIPHAVSSLQAEGDTCR